MNRIQKYLTYFFPLLFSLKKRYYFTLSEKTRGDWGLLKTRYTMNNVPLFI